MKIAFWGNQWAANLGNDCTLAAILDNVRQRIPEARLISISMQPELMSERHKVEAVAAWGPVPGWIQAERGGRLLRILRRAARQALAWGGTFRHASQFDALIVPGTAILNHFDTPFSLPYHLFRWALITRLCGGKVFVLSIGVEDAAYPLTRLFVTSVLKLAARRSFRDRRSLELARRAGFRGAAEVLPDLAFSLPRPAQQDPQSRGHGRTVAVGLLYYRFHYQAQSRGGGAAEAARLRYLDGIADLMIRLVGAGYVVKVIIGDTQDLQVAADVEARLLARGFDIKENPAYINGNDTQTTFVQLLEQLASVDFVIGSRFHNIVLGLFLCRPVLALSYEEKIEELMQEYGLGEFCRTLDEFQVDDTMEMLQKLEARGGVLRGVIASRTQQHRQQLERQYDAIMTVLAEGGGRSLS